MHKQKFKKFHPPISIDYNLTIIRHPRPNPSDVVALQFVWSDFLTLLSAFSASQQYLTLNTRQLQDTALLFLLL